MKKALLILALFALLGCEGDTIVKQERLEVESFYFNPSSKDFRWIEPYIVQADLIIPNIKSGDVVSVYYKYHGEWVSLPHCYAMSHHYYGVDDNRVMFYVERIDLLEIVNNPDWYQIRVDVIFMGDE